MLKRLSAASALALLVAAGPALAQPVGEQPRWIRHPALAPDGSMLSFTYRGQVHLVDTEGGLAVPLTAQGAYSYGAVWSPDGEYLALASDVNGNDDVYIADFSGTLQRFSWSSANEVPTGFSPDGRAVLYTAPRMGDAERSIQAALSRKPQLYAVDTRSGRESLVLPNMALEARWNPDQTQLVYTYDPSSDPSERQHRVAANARQLWIYHAASGTHEQVFPVDGVDRLNPVWSADGQSLYYLSEASGWLNAWRVDLETLEEVQLTDFADDPVRDLSVADDGTIAFARGGRIFVQAPQAEAPAPIEIMTLEQRAGNDLNFLASDITEFVASPDGERFAVIAHTDVYLLDRSGLYRQITATAGEEKNVGFSPDGATLVYAAQRGHEWGIYGVDLQVEEDGPPLALRYEEFLLHLPEKGNAFQPVFSPDGSRLAFIADRREVQVMDLASGQVHELFGLGDYNSSYTDGDLWFAWSPTSRELLVQWRTASGDQTSRVAIVPADGSAPPQPLPVMVDGLFQGSWSLDGTQIVAGTAHYGVRSAQLRSLGMDLYRVFVSEAARQDFLDLYEGEAPEAVFDEEGNFTPRLYDAGGFRSQGLENRLTFGMAPPIFIEPYDQQRLLVVTAQGEDQYGIGFIDLKSGQLQPLHLLSVPGLSGLSYVPALGVIDFLADGEILTLPLSDPSAVTSTPVEIYYASNRDRAREAAFEQAWADLNYTYYDPGLEGRDWQAIGAKYRAYLGSIASDRELRELISAMYGELSASHMFVSYDADAAGEGVGTHNDVLGVYLDHGYEGEGRRVAAVLPGGPLDRAGLGVDAGDIITSINGQPVPEAGGLDRLLDLNFGKRVLVGLIDGEGQDERLIYVDPISRLEEHALTRLRLTDARREMTDRLSRGCVVYQHVPAMDNPAYLDVLGRLSSARGMARAALIDVRSNGGGNLTRELITLLTGQPYATMRVVDGPEVIEPSNRWLWPSAVLVDSFGYSDGSVFPQAFQDLGLGPLVGDTVLNTGTAVNYVDSKLVPGLTYGIPVLPFHRLDGSLYENYVIEPDISVPHDPNNVGIGVDPQLEAGVAALMEQIGADADCRLR